MKRRLALPATFLAVLGTSLAACGGRSNDVGDAGAPPVAKVEKEQDVSLLSVEHPDQFPLFEAISFSAPPTLSVTGTVNPDISRTVPVISLATGRVVEIRARLGDTVEKGQVLLRVQSPDIAGAFSDYRKAVADEVLANKQLERAQLLYDKGAISLGNLQLAQDTEDKAKVDVETTLEHLRVLGVDKDHPSGIVEIRAPISGVITDQQVTNAAGIQGLSGANPFTISDLSSVWILCDVYENDLANVHIGETADIILNAYPDKKFTGTISNIGPILDPNLRTAKVRIQVANPDLLMRVGMFVTATFRGRKKVEYVSVPASAILHLHDRDWVYVPAGGNKFRRVEVLAGDTLPDKMQEIRSGIPPGQQVVKNALVMQSTVEQ
jgi:membrane fusion protein, heavy metal efflux system